MAVPAYLASSFSYIETAPITDVDSIITEFRDQVLNHNTPAWTEPSGGLFKSPADGSGRWFDVLLTKIAAGNLECRVRDSSGVTMLTGRMQIGTVSLVRIFTGQFHFHIETVGTTPEFAAGGIIDLSPESQTAHSQWAYAYTYRDTSDAVRTNVTWEYDSMNDNGSYAIYRRHLGFSCVTTGKLMQSASGAYIFGAAGVLAKEIGGGGLYKYAGRFYQHVVCPDDVLGAEYVIPTDATSYGTFKVLGKGASLNERLACRIA
jgi:hypothetical protein